MGLDRAHRIQRRAVGCDSPALHLDPRRASGLGRWLFAASRKAPDRAPRYPALARLRRSAPGAPRRDRRGVHDLAGRRGTPQRSLLRCLAVCRIASICAPLDRVGGSVRARYRSVAQRPARRGPGRSLADGGQRRSGALDTISQWCAAARPRGVGAPLNPGRGVGALRTHPRAIGARRI